jgi:DnaK suppressor protein
MSGAHMYNAAVILSPSGFKQMAARKKPSRKKTTSKSRKPVAKKMNVPKKKVTRKVAKKKATARKKPPGKKTDNKKAAKKKISKKKSTGKKSIKKKVLKKPSKKRTAKSTVTNNTAKKAATNSGATKKASKKNTKKVTNLSTTARSGRKRHKISADNLIHGIKPYQLRKGEEFMNDAQREHFRNILMAWKQELMQEVDRTVHHMQDEASNFPDPNDRATQESEFGLELRTRDRERKLLKKIAQAISRIDDESYGYCEETGEEIGLQRLEARPVATLCVEAQERRELADRQNSDRDD